MISFGDRVSFHFPNGDVMSGTVGDYFISMNSDGVKCVNNAAVFKALGILENREHYARQYYRDHSQTAKCADWPLYASLEDLDRLLHGIVRDFGIKIIVNSRSIGGGYADISNALKL